MDNFTFEVECNECAGAGCSASFSDSYDAQAWADNHVCDEQATAEYNDWIEDLGAKARAAFAAKHL
jgi:hypothetical protein